MLHLIDNFLKTYTEDDDIIVTTHVTSPFLTTRTIIDAVKKLDKGHDSVVSVTKSSDHSWVQEENNSYSKCFHKGLSPNTLKFLLGTLSDVSFIITNNLIFFILLDLLGSNFQI